MTGPCINTHTNTQKEVSQLGHRQFIPLSTLVSSCRRQSSLLFVPSVNSQQTGIVDSLCPCFSVHELNKLLLASPPLRLFSQFAAHSLIPLLWPLEGNSRRKSRKSTPFGIHYGKWLPWATETQVPVAKLLMGETQCICLALDWAEGTVHKRRSSLTVAAPSWQSGKSSGDFGVCGLNAP